MKITILLRNNEITEYLTEENLVTIEMPYGAIGYRFNGSSLASEYDLNIYWDTVDKIFLELGLNTDQYLTLISMD